MKASYFYLGLSHLYILGMYFQDNPLRILLMGIMALACIIAWHSLSRMEMETLKTKLRLIKLKKKMLEK